VKRRILFLILGVVVLASTVPIALAATRSAHSAKTSIGVTGKEFKFRLTATTARHGSITFRLTNRGTLKHDFKIDGKKTPLISPGKSASITVSLARGSWKYLCTVKGHAAAGMRGTFRVR
jgi:uncharacterized cupredoxin-like copper-binding protein